MMQEQMTTFSEDLAFDQAQKYIDHFDPSQGVMIHLDEDTIKLKGLNLKRDS